jgi:hypothetical protein
VEQKQATAEQEETLTEAEEAAMDAPMTTGRSRKRRSSLEGSCNAAGSVKSNYDLTSVLSNTVAGLKDSPKEAGAHRCEARSGGDAI